MYTELITQALSACILFEHSMPMNLQQPRKAHTYITVLYPNMEKFLVDCALGERNWLSECKEIDVCA